jgi:hypothetical protein
MLTSTDTSAFWAAHSDSAAKFQTYLAARIDGNRDRIRKRADHAARDLRQLARLANRLASELESQTDDTD